ncbi:caspase family protein [bacterium]|nr:caspase family protein [bacterium]
MECVLTDQQATDQNIIQEFHEHLCNATGNDTVWFHFSGHGCEQYTANEFLRSIGAAGNEMSVEPNGKDQTLVCYKSPGTA